MFNKSATNKVKFQDQQLDDYVLENSVLKSKLQSKIDALSIMSKELDKCSMERDRFKLLVEQLKSKKLPFRSENTNNIYRFTPTNTISGSDMLTKTRDHNNILKLEVEMLHSKLEEATGDIVVLRKQLQKKDEFQESCGSKKSSNIYSYSNKDYEQLVQELERIKKKYQQIQLDYRATLDEKEELVSDRDYYKNKVQRLNHQISYVLSNRTKVLQTDKIDPPKPIVDIDALVMENKYLHERITQLQVEKEIIKRTLTKYKTLLDNRNKDNYSLQLKKGFTDVMTQKQVREFLDINLKGTRQRSAAELKSICLGLFEALNDKSIALQHQRKTNQILANRITELEKTLENWCNGQKYIPIFPSQMLLDEFIDNGSVKSDDSKEKKLNESHESDDNKGKYSDSDENKDCDEDINDDDDHVKDCNVSDSDRNCDERQFGDANQSLSNKTVLPKELEELVKEALAELKAEE
ncbi:hypothetical protein K1T71_001234 [Dendrolimus kikuchii]|uniref:Uncharacterized protein n=1 Tax=Dendrolimus kikuchii TaxID=765133 RepID=A0ACC1DH09_9NEOP|nr:hypothetical protein K1T71_001234 [Dendrolimus kikuchii]